MARARRYALSMAQSAWSGLLVAALAGAVAGGVAGWAGSSTSSSDVRAEPAAAVPPAGQSEATSVAGDGDPPAADDRLQRRVKELERAVAELERRKRKRAELTKLAKERSDDGEVPAGAVDAEDPHFELAVREVMDRASDERRAERRQRRVDGQLDLFAEELTLSAEQIDLVEQILIRQMDAFSALRSGDPDERPRNRREWRERIDEIRQQSRKEFGKILSKEQMATYDKLQDEDNRGPRGRRAR
jgi:hypothetical protein